MRLLLGLCLLGAVSAVPLRAQRVLAPVDVNVNSNVVKVHVTVSGGPPNLLTLARKAFDSHGRYQLVETGAAFEIKLVAVSGTEVRADVERNGAAIASQQFSGTTIYNALLKAGDFAVEKTNGLGLKGYFASRLAFISESSGKKEIYTADLFFSPGSATQWTTDRSQILTPRWSPDGRKLVYTSYVKGVPDIYVRDIVAGTTDRIINVQGTNQGGRYSPNGREIVMVLSGTGSSEIWASDAQGHGLSRKTRSDTVKSSPVWSPDGSQILFAMSVGTSPQLFLMSSAGGIQNPQRLPNLGFTYAAEPDWSRGNPNKIVFTTGGGARNQLAVYDRSTGGPAKPISTPGNSKEPSWLPDGRHVVYTMQTGNSSRLYIVDTESGKSTAISPANLEPAFQASVWAP